MSQISQVSEPQVTAAIITGIAAVVAAIIALVGVIITVRKSNKELLHEFQKKSELDAQRLEAKLDKNQAVTETIIAELTREVRLHNGFAQSIPVIQNDVKTIYKRLDKIEDQSNDGK